MTGILRLCVMFVWCGGLVPLGIEVTAAAAATRNVSTTAQLVSAIANAQAGDTIVLAPGIYRPLNRLTIAVDLTIQGDTAAPSIIDGGGENIFQVRANLARFENLTLRNGRTAISWEGRGVFVLRGVTITGHTIAGLTADSGEVVIVNSTIAGNVDTEGFGTPASGIEMSCTSLSLNHVTISGNDRGLNINFPCGETFFATSALIAGNGEDCVARGDYTLSAARSLDSDGTCRAAENSGTSGFATVTNPGLGSLADNGGPTMTMALSATSPAVNAGTLCTELLDQRGAVRDSQCDIGAFERSSAVSMASATGAGNVVASTDNGTFVNFHPVSEADMPNQSGKPTGVTFPYGFFEWSIGIASAGGAANVAMTFPTPVATPAQYWKVINGVWTNVCLQLTCVVNGNTLTIAFRDGGIGDLDGIVNAVIVDPGGLGSGGDIDSTPPDIHCDGPDGQWHANDVNITCTASDHGSGLANASDASFSLPTNVAAGTETSSAPTDSRLVCDVAGNCVTAGPIGGNRVDKKAPHIAIVAPGNGDVYLLNAAVASAYACNDPGSGIATCSGPVADGANVPTTAVGATMFSVTASDQVGNVASASAGYTVTFGTCLLYDPILAKKSGSTYAITLQLCDGNGRNVSSPSIVLHATSLTQTSTIVGASLNDSGNANPDFDFRYDASLGGYVFNLKTTGLTTGTYNLNFTAGSDPVVHSAPFAIR